ncbi:hypothetical protein [uncultured Umboniibacter sp.]|uniref:hypothetical protein n=1 Tax=uncultured Umboniibacter sp. TaxID=1798917 RepID=UPI002632AF8B|nr:hypothetical protein [uncultured Umboniibacter sp.]
MVTPTRHHHYRLSHQLTEFETEALELVTFSSLDGDGEVLEEDAVTMAVLNLKRLTSTYEMIVALDEHPLLIRAINLFQPLDPITVSPHVGLVSPCFLVGLTHTSQHVSTQSELFLLETLSKAIGLRSADRGEVITVSFVFAEDESDYGAYSQAGYQLIQPGPYNQLEAAIERLSGTDTSTEEPERLSLDGINMIFKTFITPKGFA